MVGFNGAETASRESFLDQAGVSEGPSLSLMDAENLCAFGRFCDTHGKVWNQVAHTDDPLNASRPQNASSIWQCRPPTSP